MSDDDKWKKTIQQALETLGPDALSDEELDLQRNSRYLTAIREYNAFKRESGNYTNRSEEVEDFVRYLVNQEIPELKDFTREEATATIAADQERRKKLQRGISATIAGAAILAGVIWYLFTNQSSHESLKEQSTTSGLVEPKEQWEGRVG